MTICFVCVKGGGNFAPLKLQNATKCRIFISPSAATALKGKNLTISNLFTATVLPPDVQNNNTW